MTYAELDLNRLYTYADYLKWQFEERVELIKGRIFPLSAPNARHQALSGELYRSFANFLHKKPCKVYSAPYDVYLTLNSRDGGDTVVQPDVCVVCDPAKRQMKGCVGAPDIVVEVLSPYNNVKELKDKFSIYEEAGVLEYWIVSPQDNTFLVNTLVNGTYVTSHPMVAGDTVTTPIFPGFAIDLKEFFDTEM